MKTAIYVRQSLDRDDTKLAITRQREDLLRLCKQRGWDDPLEYCDNSVSASKGTRPAYTQLCEDIEGGIVGKVAVWDMDRLHRQPRELEDFIELADRCRVELATVTGDVDLSTDNGRLYARIKGAVAKSEMERKSKRQKAANRQRAQNGRAWNVRTFGYDSDRLVQVEADAIAKATRELLNGGSLLGIAREWNSAGLKTVKGYRWNGSTVRQVLSRPRNAGLAVYDVHSAKRVSDAILEGVEVPWPAIVSRDEFNSLLALLADPARHSGKKQALRYLLSGLAYCGVCGHKLKCGSRPTKRVGVRRTVYQCGNMDCLKIVRAQEKVDTVVVDMVTGRLARPDAAQLFARDAVDTKALAAQADKLRAQIAAAEREYDEGLIDGRRLKGRRDTLQPKLDAIEVQIVGAQTSRKLDGLMGNVKARAVFEALPLARQRAVIDTVCTVTVRPNDRLGGAFDPTKVDVQWR